MNTINEKYQESIALHSESAKLYYEQNNLNENTRLSLKKDNEIFKKDIYKILPYINIIKNPMLISADDYSIFSVAGTCEKQSFKITNLPNETPAVIAKEIKEYIDISCCYEKNALLTKLKFSNDFSGHVGISESKAGYIKGNYTFGCELFVDENDNSLIRNMTLQNNVGNLAWKHRPYWHINKGKTVWLFSPFIVANKLTENTLTPLSIQDLIVEN